jgi:hypothetical protein
MSEVKVNKISPRTNCGTVQLGDSGDTITIPAGATIVNNGTQTGFGRTGTVDWDTTAKTASFTAVSGNGYFVNTTSGAITVTLPASPSAGDIVAVADYAGTAATNLITIARNGSNFEGGTDDGAIAVNRQTGTFVYADATQGWIAVNSNDASFILPTYMSATGGTITTCGNCKIHTFTGPGTFCVSSISNTAANNEVSYIVAAGGGGGGWDVGGGGGAGGYRETKSPVTSYTASPLCGYSVPGNRITVTATAFPITVGGGGAGSPGPNTDGVSGANSIFSTITSAGGGGGGGHSGRNGVSGGSGGGGAGYTYSTTGGAGNTPPVSPPQGNNGGNATSPSVCQTGGGGGGATAAGSNSTSPGNTFTPSAAGATTGISGSSVTYSAGGRGAGDSSPSPACGTANRGNGGDGTGAPPVAGSGGSGIVIIRYKYQ